LPPPRAGSSLLSIIEADGVLVNTSRAPIIAEGALVEALQKGRPGFAAIDVYESEPVVGAAHPLLKLKNVICTPHLGYCEQDQYESIYGGAVKRLLAYAEGKPIDVINPEALKKAQA
jgi:D-3-phosphoglycerate dehydrogenase / 2-oxoglutarate reductase